MLSVKFLIVLAHYLQGSQLAEQVAGRGFAVQPPASAATLCIEHWCAVNSLIACAPTEFVPADDSLRAAALRLRDALAVHEAFFWAPPGAQDTSDSFAAHAGSKSSVVGQLGSLFQPGQPLAGWSEASDEKDASPFAGESAFDAPAGASGSGARPHGDADDGNDSAGSADSDSAGVGEDQGGEENAPSRSSITEVFKAVTSPRKPALPSAAAAAAAAQRRGPSPEIESFGLESARLLHSEVVNNDEASTPQCMTEQDCIDSGDVLPFSVMTSTAPIAAVLLHFHQTAFAKAGSASSSRSAHELSDPVVPSSQPECPASPESFGEAAPAAFGDKAAATSGTASTELTEARPSAQPHGSDSAAPDSHFFPNATPHDQRPEPPVGYPTGDGIHVPPHALHHCADAVKYSKPVHARELPDDMDGPVDTYDGVHKPPPGKAGPADARARWRTKPAPAASASSSTFSGREQPLDVHSAAATSFSWGGSAVGGDESFGGSFRGRNSDDAVSSKTTTLATGADSMLPPAEAFERPGSSASPGGGGSGAGAGLDAFGGLPDVEADPFGAGPPSAAAGKRDDDSDSDDEAAFGAMMSSKHRTVSTCLDLH